MLGFPLPYQDELVYSIIARAKVRLALESPKQLLDLIFNNRKVIATVDLPCHLSVISDLYLGQQLSVLDLIYQHTLFPIYAPFMPENRRQKCIQLMSSESQGAVHLATGMNASRIPIVSSIRYCPQCINDQLDLYKEAYWKREWQVGGTCCVSHGTLRNTDIGFRSNHRHEFVAVNDIRLESSESRPLKYQCEVIVTHKVRELLDLGEKISPSFAQWTQFYQLLAARNDCLRGNCHIDHEKIIERVHQKWSSKFLLNYGLSDLESDTSWLKAIFRKHRKSFSYLEHIVVLEAFNDSNWKFSDVFQVISVMPLEMEKQASNNTSIDDIDNSTLENRQQWQGLLDQYSVKSSRLLNGALYAWLYKHDKNWLLEINKKHHIPKVQGNRGIDWVKRDLVHTKRLLYLQKKVVLDMQGPRRSAQWWLNQLGLHHTYTKKKEVLPLMNLFLERYRETISDYQIRRVSKVIIGLFVNNEKLPRWQILRLSGLSDERMTEETKDFLDMVLQQQSDK